MWKTILGDPFSEGLPPPTTYEGLHHLSQDILIPLSYAVGATVNVTQPISENFALTHRMYLESGKQRSPMMMMPGLAPKVADEPSRRHYALGAVFSKAFPDGGKLRVASSMSNAGAFKTVAKYAPFGSDRVVLTGQFSDAWNRGKAAVGPDVAMSAEVRGADYGATARLLSRGSATDGGKEVSVSYLQRLAPGSPLSFGGEVLFNASRFLGIPAAAAASAAPASASKGTAQTAAPKKVIPALEWSVGGAFDSANGTTSLHVDCASGPYRDPGVPVFALHHVQRVTDRSMLVGKVLVRPDLASMFAIGYRLRFRNTGTVLTGNVDSYGGLTTLIDRELSRTARVGLYSKVDLLRRAAPELGLRMTIGGMAPIPPQRSPVLLSRNILGLQT